MDESWSVDDVTDTTVFVPGQGAQPGKKIQFTTFTGNTSTVEIPDSQFTPENVAAKVDDMATKIMQAMTLKGTPVVATMTNNMPQFNPETGLYEEVSG